MKKCLIILLLIFSFLNVTAQNESENWDVTGDKDPEYQKYLDRCTNKMAPLGIHLPKDLARIIQQYCTTYSQWKQNGEKLFKKIMEDDFYDIRQMLDAATKDFNIDLNSLYKENKNALMLASYFGKTKIVKLLLQYDVDVNLKDCFGNTAIIMAAMYNHLEIVQMLIDHGADVNSPNFWGETAITDPCTRNLKEMVELLIFYKANVNVHGIGGFTPLMNSIIYNHVEIVRLLLDAGADLYSKNNYGQTAIDLSQNPHTDIRIIELLKSHIKIHFCTFL